MREEQKKIGYSKEKGKKRKALNTKIIQLILLSLIPYSLRSFIPSFLLYIFSLFRLSTFFGFYNIGQSASSARFIMVIYSSIASRIVFALFFVVLLL